jgi:hypothetical protein
MALTWERLGDVCALLGIESLPRLRRVAETHLIPDVWPAHWRSAIWTAAGANARGIGLKAYFNLTAGTPVERWRRAGNLLLSLGRRESLARLCHLSYQTSRDSWPIGIAIDLGRGPNPEGVKIYFRSGEVSPAWVARWYRACDLAEEEEAVRLLLETFAPPSQEHYPEGAMVVSLEFPSSDEAPALKTEIEMSRWIKTEKDAIARVRRFVRNMNLSEEHYLASIEALETTTVAESSHRLIGVRSDQAGARRVNVYLEPAVSLQGTMKRTHRSAKVRPTLGGVMVRAVEWLEQARAKSDSEPALWRDYELPVGMADHWTTAYTTCLLSLAGEAVDSAKVQQLRRDGCDALEARRTPGGGWGFNATTPDDADSTALALLALARNGRAIPAEAETVIGRCLQPDGGIATYPPHVPPGGAWSLSTPDVTSTAIAAMELDAARPTFQAALSWMLSRQRADGAWQAYWWTTQLYPAFWAAKVFGPHMPPAAQEQLRAFLRSYRPARAFETALHVLALDAMGERHLAIQGARALAQDQRRDGSWEPGAALRLASPSVKEPWRVVDSGPCYLDQNGIFTTATALGAIARGLALEREVSTATHNAAPQRRAIIGILLHASARYSGDS